MTNLRYLVEATLRDVTVVLHKSQVPAVIIAQVRARLAQLIAHTAEHTSFTHDSQHYDPQVFCREIAYELADFVSTNLAPERSVQKLENINNKQRSEISRLEATVRDQETKLVAATTGLQRLQNAHRFALEALFKEVHLLRQRNLAAEEKIYTVNSEAIFDYRTYLGNLLEGQEDTVMKMTSLQEEAIRKGAHIEGLTNAISQLELNMREALARASDNADDRVRGMGDHLRTMEKEFTVLVGATKDELQAIKDNLLAAQAEQARSLLLASEAVGSVTLGNAILTDFMCKICDHLVALTDEDYAARRGEEERDAASKAAHLTSNSGSALSLGSNGSKKDKQKVAPQAAPWQPLRKSLSVADMAALLPVLAQEYKDFTRVRFQEALVINPALDNHTTRRLKLMLRQSEVSTKAVDTILSTRKLQQHSSTLDAYAKKLAKRVAELQFILLQKQQHIQQLAEENKSMRNASPQSPATTRQSLVYNPNLDKVVAVQSLLSFRDVSSAFDGTSSLEAGQVQPTASNIGRAGSNRPLTLLVPAVALTSGDSDEPSGVATADIRSASSASERPTASPQPLEAMDTLPADKALDLANAANIEGRALLHKLFAIAVAQKARLPNMSSLGEETAAAVEGAVFSNSELDRILSAYERHANLAFERNGLVFSRVAGRARTAKVARCYADEMSVWMRVAESRDRPNQDDEERLPWMIAGAPRLVNCVKVEPAADNASESSTLIPPRQVSWEVIQQGVLKLREAHRDREVTSLEKCHLLTLAMDQNAFELLSSLSRELFAKVSGQQFIPLNVLLASGGEGSSRSGKSKGLSRFRSVVRFINAANKWQTFTGSGNKSALGVADSQPGNDAGLRASKVLEASTLAGTRKNTVASPDRKAKSSTSKLAGSRLHGPAGFTSLSTPTKVSPLSAKDLEGSGLRPASSSGLAASTPIGGAEIRLRSPVIRTRSPSRVMHAPPTPVQFTPAKDLAIISPRAAKAMATAEVNRLLGAIGVGTTSPPRSGNSPLGRRGTAHNPNDLESTIASLAETAAEGNQWLGSTVGSLVLNATRMSMRASVASPPASGEGGASAATRHPPSPTLDREALERNLLALLIEPNNNPLADQSPTPLTSSRPTNAAMRSAAKWYGLQSGATAGWEQWAGEAVSDRSQSPEKRFAPSQPEGKISAIDPALEAPAIAHRRPSPSKPSRPNSAREQEALQVRPQSAAAPSPTESISYQTVSQRQLLGQGLDGPTEPSYFTVKSLEPPRCITIPTTGGLSDKDIKNRSVVLLTMTSLLSSQQDLHAQMQSAGTTVAAEFSEAPTSRVGSASAAHHSASASSGSFTPRSLRGPRPPSAPAVNMHAKHAAASRAKSATVAVPMPATVPHYQLVVEGGRELGGGKVSDAGALSILSADGTEHGGDHQKRPATAGVVSQPKSRLQRELDRIDALCSTVSLGGSHPSAPLIIKAQSAEANAASEPLVAPSSQLPNAEAMLVDKRSVAGYSSTDPKRIVPAAIAAVREGKREAQENGSSSSIFLGGARRPATATAAASAPKSSRGQGRGK